MRCKTVTVIEDDADVRASIRNVLTSEGYEVQTADNGRDGLDLLHKMTCPCLILLDLMMPVMNGWDFIATIQRDAQLQQIPIVVLSAGGDLAKAEKHHVGYLKKPLDIEQLVGVVQNYCGVPPVD